MRRADIAPYLGGSATWRFICSYRLLPDQSWLIKENVRMRTAPSPLSSGREPRRRPRGLACASGLRCYMARQPRPAMDASQPAIEGSTAG